MEYQHKEVTLTKASELHESLMVSGHYDWINFSTQPEYISVGYADTEDEAIRMAAREALAYNETASERGKPEQHSVAVGYPMRNGHQHRNTFSGSLEELVRGEAPNSLAF